MTDEWRRESITQEVAMMTPGRNWWFQFWKPKYVQNLAPVTLSVFVKGGPVELSIIQIEEGQ